MPLQEDSIEIPSWPDVKARLERALALVEENDLELLEDDCHECSVAHHLARYLKEEFPEWHVDIEFNRDRRNRGTKRDSNGTPVRPDVIVHKRREPQNLLAIELKKTTRNKASETREKLCDYQKTQGYKYTVFQLYEVGHSACFHPPELVVRAN